MNISEIIQSADSVRNNQYSDDQKIEWISNLDTKIHDDIISVFNEGESRFIPYRSISQNVIAPNRYKQMYVLYLMAQIDFNNAEMDRYNNDMYMFNNEYNEYARAYIRSHTYNKEIKV